MNEHRGGRSITKARSQLEKNLAHIEKMLDDPNVPAQVKGRLLQAQTEALIQERRIEADSKRNRHEERLAAQAEKITQLEAEIAALKERVRMVGIADSIDETSFLTRQISAYQHQVQQLENERATLEHTLTGRLSEAEAKIKELEELRPDAEKWREHQKQQRIEHLKKRVAEWDAMDQRPGLTLGWTRQQYEKYERESSTDRKELRELLGQPEPKRSKPVLVHPDILSDRVENERLTQGVEAALQFGQTQQVFEVVQESRVRRTADGQIRLYGSEPVPPGWED